MDGCGGLVLRGLLISVCASLSSPEGERVA
jgi:hypothetical protein